jgi:hypothetical protein
MKIVYNDQYGGDFILSDKAMRRYADLKGIFLSSENADWEVSDELDHDSIERHDPALVQVVEELGEEANTARSRLLIRDVPSGERYRIEQHDDGSENVMLI